MNALPVRLPLHDGRRCRREVSRRAAGAMLVLLVIFTLSTCETYFYFHVLRACGIPTLPNSQGTT